MFEELGLVLLHFDAFDCWLVLKVLIAILRRVMLTDRFNQNMLTWRLNVFLIKWSSGIFLQPIVLVGQ